MTESDGEIEYLEEDADIVQQYVQLSQDSEQAVTKKPGPASKTMQSKHVSLQAIIRPSQKKRWNNKMEEYDSDYDPNGDDQIVSSPPSPPPSPLRKKKIPVAKTSSNTLFDSLLNQNSSETKQSRPKFNRKNFNIRVPDYDDPLCLPVRAIKSTESDLKRLNNWNKVCLEHMKNADVMLKPEKGASTRSNRTSVFKNVVNKQSGNIETTIWSKISVENAAGDKKSEIFQCVLPRYKEKKVLNNFILGNKRFFGTRTVDHALLSKENHKDGEVLVVYKPKESLSAVYKLMVKSKSEGEESTIPPNEECRMYLKETTSAKICAPCYQTSWRGVTKTNKRSLVCPICDRFHASIYNLLSHLKTHKAGDVTKYKDKISRVLSEVVGYHYQCRICRRKYENVKNLRKHVKTHQSKEEFVCEIGNHKVNA